MSIQVKDTRPREAKSIIPNGMIARYESESHYGGPEEGGWWYDRDEAMSIVLVFSEDASLDQKRAVVIALNTRELKQREERGDRPEYQSGPPKVHYHIEDEFGEDDNMNDPRPRYE